MYRRILYDEEDYDEKIIAFLLRPRIFYERVNYCELYDDHDFINRFRISKATFTNVLRLIKNEISHPS